MTFLERVENLLATNNMSKNKMLTDLKIAKGAFGNWQERGTVPGGETILKIAEYFHVSTDYLLGKTDNPAPVAQNQPQQRLRSIARLEKGDLTEQEDEQIADFIQWVLSKRDGSNGDPNKK